MFRTTITKKLLTQSALKPTTGQLFLKNAPRFFSSSAIRNGIPVALKGKAVGFQQTLKPVGGTQHVIQNDGFKDIGGLDAHPDPIQHLFSSLSGCQHLTAQVVAQNLGIKTGEATIDIQAELEPVEKAKGVYPGFNISSFTLNYTLETNADDAKFAQLKKVTEAKCPVAQVFLNTSGIKVFNNNWINAPLKK